MGDGLCERRLGVAVSLFSSGGKEHRPNTSDNPGIMGFCFSVGYRGFGVDRALGFSGQVSCHGRILITYRGDVLVS